MNQDSKPGNGKSSKSNRMALGLTLGAGIGVALGAGIGAAMDNIAFGAGSGVALGPAVGLTLAIAMKPK